MNNIKCIVFEGIDGSGKTTQAKKMANFYNNKGIKCLYKHIFDSKAGNIIREIFLNNEFSNTIEILLLCATRQALFDELKDEIKKYDLIIIDRMFLSILAMQGKSEGDKDLINYIKKYIFNCTLDVYTFYLNTSPKECRRRMLSRNITDRIEEKGLEFHKMVYNRYVDLLYEEKNVYIFNGELEEELLSIEIINTANEILKLEKN